MLGASGTGGGALGGLTHRDLTAGAWDDVTHRLTDDVSKLRRPVGTMNWVRRKATQALARWLWLTRDGRKLIVFIVMNALYFTVEMAWGLYTARIGLISDAFHLCFGCCVLTVSLYAIAHSRRGPDLLFSYGYGRMEVLAGFTNACFLLFMAGSSPTARRFFRFPWKNTLTQKKLTDGTHDTQDASAYGALVRTAMDPVETHTTNPPTRLRQPTLECSSDV